MIVKMDYLSSLPDEIALIILSFLEENELLKMRNTSLRWRCIVNDDLAWFYILRKRFPDVEIITPIFNEYVMLEALFRAQYNHSLIPREKFRNFLYQIVSKNCKKLFEEIVTSLFLDMTDWNLHDYAFYINQQERGLTASKWFEQNYGNYLTIEDLVFPCIQHKQFLQIIFRVINESAWRCDFGSWILSSVVKLENIKIWKMVRRIAIREIGKYCDFDSKSAVCALETKNDEIIDYFSRIL
jgi:hypothetical protein